MIRAPKICGGSHIRAGLSGYVAELTSASICAELGLPSELHDSHASYLGHWIDVLRSDHSAIFTAASKAEQAFGYLAAFSRSASGNGAAEPMKAAA